MTELRVSHLIQEGHRILESKYDVFGFVVLNREEIQDILNRIDSLLPEEVKNAERILNRRDDIVAEAQSRAERIVNEANATAEDILSKSEMVRRAKEEEKRIHEQIYKACEDMKNQALEEAENIRTKALQETAEMRDSADRYAEQILGNLATDLERIHSIVKSGQQYLENKKVAKQAIQEQQASTEEYYN